MQLGSLEALAAQAPSQSSNHQVSPDRERASGSRGKALGTSLLALFHKHGCYGRQMEEGKHAVCCPWAHEHSDHRPAEDSDTVIWEARNGRKESFCCAHDHCRGRTAVDVYAHWCPPPDPELLFAKAQAANGAERTQLVAELAEVVCGSALDTEAWAERVRAAKLATKGAFLRTAEAAQRQRREGQKAERQTALDHCAVPAARYRVENGGICLEKDTRDGPTVVALSNFDLRITGEEVRDDGAEQRVHLTVAATLGNGQCLPPVTMPADRFQSMAWIIPAWGTQAVVYAGSNTKDHLRVAAQLLSGEPPRRVVYEHVGWRKIDGEWHYLHHGGAITAVGSVNDVEVALEGKLGAFVLPDPPTGEQLAAAVSSSLDLLSLSRPELIYPLLAAVYRAPLAEVLSIDCSLFLEGTTGCQKSELSALAQAHFGPGFHGKHLPGNWASSGNSLEKAAFLIKDSLYTVDDFSPRGTSADVQRLHQTADRLFRGQGNHQGRGRMRADGTLRPEYYSRGMVLSSGEDVPLGQSCRARLVILEMRRGDINLECLTQAQHAAREGRYAEALAGYLQWLAPRLDELRRTLPILKESLRAVARGGGAAHDRVPDNIVSLALGLYTFLQFALNVGALDAAEAENHWNRGWASLLRVGAAQSGHLQHEEPTSRFLQLLSASLLSGDGHLASASGQGIPDQPELWGWQRRTEGEFSAGVWLPQGKRLGWRDGDEILLEPDTVYAAVQRIAQAQGGNFATTQQTLWKRLAERELLSARDENRGRNTVRRTIGGNRVNVICLHVGTLVGESVPIVPTVPNPPVQAGGGDGFVGQFQTSPDESVPQNRPTSTSSKHVGRPSGTIGTIGTLLSLEEDAAGMDFDGQVVSSPEWEHREVIEV